MTDLDDERAGDPLAGLPPDPNEALQMREEIVDGAVVVRAVGEVDMATRELLDLRLQAAESQVAPPAPVVLDLSGVVFLASMGLSLLVEHHERCAERGSRLIVVATDRAVLRPMQITGLTELLTVVPTVQAALTGAA
ncbi:STAS domain-containing protein [Kutzneria sp. NPDC051319]|uniref:STAS domain-containing protein n=1 Tax=Kutzneria sp. NPDC051319 TaxID=3155047 RepID=UPI00341D0F95